MKEYLIKTGGGLLVSETTGTGVGSLVRMAANFSAHEASTIPKALGISFGYSLIDVSATIITYAGWNLIVSRSEPEKKNNSNHYSNDKNDKFEEKCRGIGGYVFCTLGGVALDTVLDYTVGTFIDAHVGLLGRSVIKAAIGSGITLFAKKIAECGINAECGIEEENRLLASKSQNIQ